MIKNLKRGTVKSYNIYVINEKGDVKIMAKNRGAKKPTVVVDKNAAQFIRTAANLARKGKTNKKLNGKNANLKARKYAHNI